MAQGRSTKTISMIKCIQTSRFIYIHIYRERERERERERDRERERARERKSFARLLETTRAEPQLEPLRAGYPPHKDSKSSFQLPCLVPQLAGFR